MVQAAHRAVADGDEETLARHRGVAQHVQRHLRQRHAGQVQRGLVARHALHVAVHLGRLAQQNVQRHVDHAFARRAVFQHQFARIGGHAHHRVRATFARAQLLEQRHQFGVDGQHVAFLALVAPHFFRCQAAFFERHFSQVEDGTAAGAFHQFGEGIADAAGADVVDGEHGAHLPQGRAMVDDLLRAALDLGVAALHAVEVQLCCVAARSQRTGRAAAHADAHARPTQLHQQRVGAEGQFLHLAGADAAQPAGDHDRLVVAALHAGHGHFEDAEKAAQVRATELVVEGRAAERALGHDLQRAGDVRRPADGLAFPGLEGAGQMKVADAKTGHAGLGPRAAAGGAFVAYLTAGSGGRAREGRDGSGVVVRLHLHQHMRHFVARAVLRGARVALRQPALHGPAFHHRRVVVVGHHRVLRRSLLGVADDAEHRLRL